MNKIAFGLLAVVFLMTSCGGENIQEVKTGDNFEQVKLPDGSIVLLNKNTTISYSTSFEPREVELDGEAYFDVVSNSASFTVKTKFGDVSVLGTSFDVNTASENMEVAVDRGAVEVKAADKEVKKSLKKGEKAVVDNTNKAIKKVKSDFKHNKWIKDLKVEFKKLGKEVEGTAKIIKKGGKKVKKESKNVLKDVKKESKKIKNKLN